MPLTTKKWMILGIGGSLLIIIAIIVIVLVLKKPDGNGNGTGDGDGNGNGDNAIGEDNGCIVYEGEARADGTFGNENITQLETDSVEACCDECTRTPNCKTFVYKEDDGSCWLKEGIYGHNIESRPGYVYGYSQALSYPSCYLFEGEAKSDDGGGEEDIIMLVRNSLTLPSKFTALACCRECTLTDDCETFVYKEDNENDGGTCWLKRGIYGNHKDSRPGYVSGYSQGLSCTFYEGEAKSEDGTEDITMVADKTAKECCQACNAEDECQTFVYKPETQQCWLKQGRHDRSTESRPGYVYGYSPPTGEEGFTLDTAY